MTLNQVSNRNSDSPSDLKGFTIPAKNGERMYACLFQPQGGGPRPTVLLLHGYPGDENNYDLAHVFQRAGYTVVIFHYRGTWGSEGLFSLGHVLEDVSSAVGFIRQHSGEETFQFDAEKLMIIGHSMGGFAALQTAARDSHLLGAAAIAAFDFSLASKMPCLHEAIQKEFADCLPIHRIDLDGLMKEIDENAMNWSFPALADGLSTKPVCLIGAEKDVISLPKYHLTPLAELLRQNAGAKVTVKLLDDGHCLSGTRIELAEILLSWMNSLFENRQSVQ